MTEEEARKKWCPFSRAGGEPGCNRLSDTQCIASECMAWRWDDVSRVHYRDTELWSKSKGVKVSSAWGDDAEWRPRGDDANKEPPAAQGYCGLAGSCGGQGHFPAPTPETSQ